ncbi:hypothetical protein F2P81_005586 [Scophthalmus maximus]|uniref:Uncharacterized protein n=1 Tax=Scophthalmus maximus TaxID=52904 RepID=A0A6A4TFQ6_SCOMX|nr:hypothetical protein F2P81_005586 [Scophthalmus maximus]
MLICDTLEFDIHSSVLVSSRPPVLSMMDASIKLQMFELIYENGIYRQGTGERQVFEKDQMLLRDDNRDILFVWRCCCAVPLFVTVSLQTEDMRRRQKEWERRGGGLYSGGERKGECEENAEAVDLIQLEAKIYCDVMLPVLFCASCYGFSALSLFFTVELVKINLSPKFSAELIFGVSCVEIKKTLRSVSSPHVLTFVSVTGDVAATGPQHGISVRRIISAIGQRDTTDVRQSSERKSSPQMRGRDWILMTFHCAVLDCGASRSFAYQRNSMHSSAAHTGPTVARDAAFVKVSVASAASQHASPLGMTGDADPMKRD